MPLMFMETSAILSEFAGYG